MPKQTLVLREFTSGLIASEHGSDLPDNCIVEGANININNDPGVIQLAGCYIPAVRPDDVNLDGTTETFNAPGNYIGIPGRGLYYFTSDYNSLAVEGASGGGWYGSEFPSTGRNYRIGNTSSLNAPTEYFVLGTRHTNHRNHVTSPGFPASSISISIPLFNFFHSNKYLIKSSVVGFSLIKSA